MPRLALALTALSAAAFLLSGCVVIHRDAGYYRRPPPGYHDGGPYRRW